MQPRLNINASLLVSTLCIAVVALVLAFSTLPPFISAAFSSTRGASEVGDRFAMLLESYDEQQDTYLARFEGRSIFFKPKQPPPPTFREVKRDEPEIELPPVAATRPPYSGPSFAGLIGDVAWFHHSSNDLRIAVGEEESGVKVIAINQPWSVKVEYGGWEYDLSLFTYPEDDKFFQKALALKRSTPGLIEKPAPKPAANDPDPDAPPAAEPGLEPAPDAVAEAPVEGAETPEPATEEPDIVVQTETPRPANESVEQGASTTSDPSLRPKPAPAPPSPEKR